MDFFLIFYAFDRLHLIAGWMGMPTIYKKNGFRFFFYSNEGGEPPHMHVLGHGGEAKIWLEPVKIAYSHGLSPRSRREILQIIFENVRFFREKWREWHESKG